MYCHEKVQKQKKLSRMTSSSDSMKGINWQESVNITSHLFILGSFSNYLVARQALFVNKVSKFIALKTTNTEHMLWMPVRTV